MEYSAIADYSWDYVWNYWECFLSDVDLNKDLPVNVLYMMAVIGLHFDLIMVYAVKGRQYSGHIRGDRLAISKVDASITDELHSAVRSGTAR
jgi:hypothetical protein